VITQQAFRDALGECLDQLEASADGDLARGFGCALIVERIPDILAGGCGAGVNLEFERDSNRLRIKALFRMNPDDRRDDKVSDEDAIHAAAFRAG
jgi:hypothetical protein